MSPDRAIARLAATQHGAFSYQQALACGLTPDAIRHRLRTGRWIALHRAVYAVAGSSSTWERRVVAAVLAFGDSAFASHMTAAVVLGLLSVRSGVLHVTLRHGSERLDRDDIVVHQARTLGRADTQVVDGIRITSPHRTLVDLAGVLPLQGLEAALDTALLSGLVSIRSIRRYIRDRRLTHNRGVGRLRKLLDDRAAGAMYSRLERVFNQILRTAGFPAPMRQYPVGRWKIDFAYPDAKIAVELDHEWTHGSAAALRNDLRRQNELVLAGWRPLRFTEDQLRDRTEVVRVLNEGFVSSSGTAGRRGAAGRSG